MYYYLFVESVLESIKRQKKILLILLNNYYKQDQMSSNQFKSSYTDKGYQNLYQNSNQQPKGSADYFSHNSYQKQYPISGYYGSDYKYLQGAKQTDYDYKQKYNTGISHNLMNAHNTESMPSLSSYARKVNETVLPKDRFDNDMGINFSNTDGFNKDLKKNSNQGHKDFRMASSAIFPTSSQPDQFNRFPAFNLGANSNQGQGPNFGYKLPEKVPSYNPNQTAKQKRQRQIAQIKKQVESISKKTNKPIVINPANMHNMTSLQPRAARNPGISQSVIIQSNTGTQGYNTFGLGGLGAPKPNNDHHTLSIDQLYAQKKKHNEQSNKSNPFLDNTNFSSKQTKYSSNKNNYNQPIEAYSKVDSNNLSSYQPYKFQNLSQKTSSSSGRTQDKYGDAQQSTVPKSKIPSFLDSSKKNQLEMNKNSDQFQNTTGLYSKTSTQTQDFTTGFKKKKAYQAPIQVSSIAPTQKITNYPIMQPVYPKTAIQPGSQKQKQSSRIRKIVSMDYQDDTHKQAVKKFKFSDFSIGKKMGKGQFGQVLLVRHKESGWICGLKIMEKKQIKLQDYEGQIARQLSIQFYLAHRNITSLYGYFEDQKNFYLLIQFCPGGQLLQKLRKQKRMNEKDVSMIIRQVCQGVDYIHKQMIIHRDLKPQNILFTYDTVKICDFGWAVYRGQGLRKTVSGSPLYYPPQIVKGEQYDDKIDVWNIGMMTYQCLEGKIPFKVYSQLDLGKIVSDQITFPSYVDISEQAKDFILKTMKKKGQQRIEIREMLRHPFIKKYFDHQFIPSILQQFRRVIG